MQVAFIYKNNIRERFANILSLLKNIEALMQLNYHPILMVPKRGWNRKQAHDYLKEASQYYQAQVDPGIVSLVPSLTELLFDLDQSVQTLSQSLGGNAPEVVKLTGIYHNLVRRWADT